MLLALAFLASTHSAALSWTASPDGGTVNAYRAAGACAAGQTFTQVGTGITGTTFTDASVPVGSSCYYVTAVVGGAESTPSNSVTVTVLPQPPSALVAK